MSKPSDLCSEDTGKEAKNFSQIERDSFWDGFMTYHEWRDKSGSIENAKDIILHSMSNQQKESGDKI